MTPDEEVRSQELRTQLAAVLRANRELGPGYEQIAVDQLLDIVRGHRPAQGPVPRAAKAAPNPSPVATPVGQTGRSSGAPWWIWGLAVAALIYWGPALLRHSGLQSLSWIPTVLALVIFAQVVRAITRWGRRLGDVWDSPGAGPAGADPRLRSRRWS